MNRLHIYVYHNLYCVVASNNGIKRTRSGKGSVKLSKCGKELESYWLPTHCISYSPIILVQGHLKRAQCYHIDSCMHAYSTCWNTTQLQLYLLSAPKPALSPPACNKFILGFPCTAMNQSQTFIQDFIVHFCFKQACRNWFYCVPSIVWMIILSSPVEMISQYTRL